MRKNLAEVNWKIWGILTFVLLIGIGLSLFFVQSDFSIEFSQNEFTIYKGVIFFEAVVSIGLASLTVWSYSMNEGDISAGEGGSDGGGGGGGVNGGGGGGGGANVTNEINIEPQIGVPENDKLNSKDIIAELEFSDLLDSEELDDVIETKVEEAMNNSGDKNDI